MVGREVVAATATSKPVPEPVPSQYPAASRPCVSVDHGRRPGRPLNSSDTCRPSTEHNATSRSLWDHKKLARDLNVRSKLGLRTDLDTAQNAYYPECHGLLARSHSSAQASRCPGPRSRVARRVESLHTRTAYARDPRLLAHLLLVGWGRSPHCTPGTRRRLGSNSPDDERVARHRGRAGSLQCRRGTHGSSARAS